jgi:hypothetical protein
MGAAGARERARHACPIQPDGSSREVNRLVV